MAKFQFDGAREAEAARAFLVTVAVGRSRHFDAGEELTELVRSDGLEPVGLMQARRDKPDPATYLGSGKIEEIADLAKAASADVIVFDAALSAAQERNIANASGLAVMDRTELILEIFRRRAKSKEGRLQVELARPSTFPRGSCAGGRTWNAKGAVWAKRAVPARSRSSLTGA